MTYDLAETLYGGKIFEVVRVGDLSGSPFALVCGVVDHGCVPFALVVGVGFERSERT